LAIKRIVAAADDRQVGLDDRDYMRERSIFGGFRRPNVPQWDSPPARRPLRRKKTITLTLGVPVKALVCAFGVIIGLIAAPAYHRVHDAWYGPTVKPIETKHVPVRVWVPASRHGHVKIVQVRVHMPPN
jgi:hypothetical protein